MQDTFTGGYTKALLDVARWFEDHDGNLRMCRAYNSKSVRSALKALIECREELRTTGGCVSLIFDSNTREFRVKRPDEKMYRWKELHGDG